LRANTYKNNEGALKRSYAAFELMEKCRREGTVQPNERVYTSFIRALSKGKSPNVPLSFNGTGCRHQVSITLISSLSSHMKENGITIGSIVDARQGFHGMRYISEIRSLFINSPCNPLAQLDEESVHQQNNLQIRYRRDAKLNDIQARLGLNNMQASLKARPKQYAG
jgi:hypothetical protein